MRATVFIVGMVGLIGLACASEPPPPPPAPPAVVEPVPVTPDGASCRGDWEGTVRGFDGDAFQASIAVTISEPTHPTLEDFEGGACGRISEDWGRDGTCRADLRRCWVGGEVVARTRPYEVQDCDTSTVAVACTDAEMDYRRKEGRFLIHGKLRRAGGVLPQ